MVGGEQSLVICPKCKSDRVVRNGAPNGIQRYKCNVCGRRFNERTGTFLEGSRLADDVWIELVRCMLEQNSVESATEELKGMEGCRYYQ